MLVLPALFVGLLVAGYKMDVLEGRHIWMYLGAALAIPLLAFVVSQVANQPSWFSIGWIVGSIGLIIVLLFAVFGEYLSDIRSY